MLDKRRSKRAHHSKQDSNTQTHPHTDTHPSHTHTQTHPPHTPTHPHTQHTHLHTHAIVCTYAVLVGECRQDACPLCVGEETESTVAVHVRPQAMIAILVICKNIMKKRTLPLQSSPPSSSMCNCTIQRETASNT